LGSRQFGQSLDWVATSVSCVRRFAVRDFECRRLGLGIGVIL